MPEIRITDDDDLKVVIEGEPDQQARGDERTIEELAAETARHREATQRHLAAAARYRAEGDHNRIVTALTKAGIEANEAAAEYRGAVEAGDVDTQVGAQARMAEIEARRVRLLEHEQALRNKPIVPADPVEAACTGKTAATANWLRSHPEHVRDPKKLAKLQSAHFDAEAEGLVPDTPEYFSHIERQIGLGDGRARDSGDRAAAARPAMKVNPNNPSTHVQRGGRDVFLTKGERERATDGTLTWNYGPRRGQPLGVTEFARRKAAMHAEGRYNQLDDLAK
jgi:hypothetical protein